MKQQLPDPRPFYLIAVLLILFGLCCLGVPAGLMAGKLL